MDIRKLQRAIVDGLEDVKAQDVVVFNTEALSPLFERVIIASGSSNRQTKALASSVRETVKARGLPVLRTEGEDNGEWIIVDCGAAVAHIMQPSVRDYYRLEEIWGGKAVRLKQAEARAGLPKAAVHTEAAPPAGKTLARAAPRGSKALAPPHAAPSAARKKAVKATKASPAAKATAKKTAARKAPEAARKRAATAPGQTAASPPRAPARQAPARQAAGRKAAVSVRTAAAGASAPAKSAPGRVSRPAARSAAPRRATSAGPARKAAPRRKSP